MTEYEKVAFIVVLLFLITFLVGCANNIGETKSSAAYLEELNLPRTTKRVTIDIDPENYEWSEKQKVVYFDGVFTMSYARKYQANKKRLEDLSATLSNESIEEPIGELDMSEEGVEARLNEFIKFIQECIALADNYETEDKTGIIGYEDEPILNKYYDHDWFRDEKISYYENDNTEYSFFSDGIIVYFQKVKKGEVEYVYPLSEEMKNNVEKFYTLNSELKTKILTH